MARFIKYIPSEKSSWLRQFHTSLFLLLSLAVERAKRTNEECSLGLLNGDAILGSFEEAGISRKQYRHAIDKGVELKIWEIVWNPKNKNQQKRAIKGAMKSIIVNIKDSSIWDLNMESEGHQKGHQMENLNEEGAIKGPSKGHQIYEENLHLENIQNAKKGHIQESEETLSYKKESEKEKRKPLAFRPLSFKKEEFEGIRIYCDAKGLPIPDKDIRTWLLKYSVERITSNLALILQRNEPFNIKIFVTALKEDYAGEPERILMNRNFALRYKKQFSWNSLLITQQYCRCEQSGNAINFKLHSAQFEECLLKMHKTQQENYA